MTENSRLTISIDSRGARANTDRLTSSLNRVSAAGEQADRQTVALSQTLRLAASVAAGYAATLGVDKVVTDLAQLQGINSRLASLTGDLAAQQEFLRQTTDETSASYVALANGYSKLLPLYKAGLLSITDAQTITKGLADVQAQAGASAEQLGQTIFGLSQGLSAGTLRAEELNQVTEPMPGLLQALDKAAGLAAGGFRKLVNDGEVTSDFFRDTLIKALEEYEGAAAALSDNITQTFQRAGNAYTQAVQAFEEPISAASLEFADALTATFTIIGENADEIVDALTLVGTAAAVALGGRAVGAATTYAGTLATVASRAAALNAVQRGALGTTQLAISAQLIQAQGAQRSAAAALAEAQARARSLAGLQQELFVRGELTAATNAYNAAIARTTAAQTAAIAATGRLTIAQRAQAAASTAGALAGRALGASLALVGGPAGAAVLAVGGMAYLALKQSEAEKSAESLRAAVDKLSDSYFSNSDAARSAGDAQLKAAEDTLEAFRADIETLESRFSINVFQKFFDARQVDGIREAMKDVYDDIDRINKAIAAQVALADTVSPYDEQAIADAAGAFDLVGARAEAAAKILEDLAPDDAARAKLESYSKALEEALQIEAISAEDYAKGTRAIQEQIDKLDGVEESARIAEQAARELQSALDNALPDAARYREHEEQIKILTEAYEASGGEAIVYKQAVDALNESFKQNEIERQTESVREYQDALDRLNDSGDPFASYRQDIQLMEDTLVALPDKAESIALALANLDLEIRAELTVVESTDNAQALQASYAKQLKALQEFHEARNVSEAQATADVVALAKSYADQAVQIAEQATSDIRSFIAQNTDIKASVQLDVEYDAARAQAFENITDPGERNRVLAQLEAAHQNTLTELVRQGEAERKHVENASNADRFANFVNANQQQIQIAGGLAQELVGAFADKQADDAARASTDAQRLANEAAEAQRLFEQNGSESNRVAAEQARERADIADAAAKREFEQSKKAQIAQATISASLAIVNALASGGNIFVGLGMAAIVAAQTARQIAAIKRTQYNSASGDLNYSSGGTANSGGSYTPDVGQDGGGQNVQINILNGLFPNTAYDDVVADSVDRLSQQGVINGIDTGNTSRRMIGR